MGGRDSRQGTWGKRPTILAGADVPTPAPPGDCLLPSFSPAKPRDLQVDCCAATARLPSAGKGASPRRTLRTKGSHVKPLKSLGRAGTDPLLKAWGATANYWAIELVGMFWLYGICGTSECQLQENIVSFLYYCMLRLLQRAQGSIRILHFLLHLYITLRLKISGRFTR